MWVQRLRISSDKIDTMNHVVTTCMPRLFTNIYSTSLYTTISVVIETACSTWCDSWGARGSLKHQMILLTHRQREFYVAVKIYEVCWSTERKTIFTFKAHFYLNHMAKRLCTHKREKFNMYQVHCTLLFWLENVYTNKDMMNEGNSNQLMTQLMIGMTRRSGFRYMK